MKRITKVMCVVGGFVLFYFMLFDVSLHLSGPLGATPSTSMQSFELSRFEIELSRIEILPAGRKPVVPAIVLRVIDGDTLHVHAMLWPGLFMNTKIRVVGIDTPEKGWRAKCLLEKAMGSKATALVEKLAPPGSVVTLWGVAHGKFAGRFLAHVETRFGDLGQQLIAAKLARKYDGGKRKGWC